MSNQWLERYAYAVKSHLPPKVRNDVADELLSDLQDECDYRAETLERDLTDDEVQQLLQERGHPLLVAADFLPRPSLISESLFPIYAQLLRWMVMAIAIAQVCVGVIQAAQVSSLNLWQLLPQITWGTLNGSLYGFAWLTLIFYLFGESINRADIFKNWKPDSLPKVTAQGAYISRTGTAIELVVLTYFIAWINRVIPQSLGDNPIELVFADGWHNLLPWITALMFTSALLAAVKLVSPYWTRPKALIELALHIPTLIILGIISQWDAPVSIIIGHEETAKQFVFPATWFTIGLLGYAVVATIDLIKKRGMLRAMS
ncbi:hypothetical protein QWI17_13175 [Gilvimarinus sp. SDUM040013]|uniref:Uncharacterized protein n=1 Tax=Gilvimarinus gilvus TaxID=3058038 RepID=A0ABU4RTR7_9GAMM|nr:hypothetical protein [Gilvimarinus sp. SDUM040013]MDO3386792.1 hypothetical protein [Gilvimarinus sp. SDUM040013]MDX6848278.1 hypothetical protein [Gilvimarinus sp. SDUM040013]